ncbi:hypothetical protein C8Q74DRAFT_1368165 [Fomes fomentarius]|nr:hypothetical protein C8Q74DRAFT_1368165 [Fomes fomentarius]
MADAVTRSYVHTLLGEMFIEISLACALYGVTTIQCFVYYRTFTWKETQRMKLMVGAIWFLETLHTAFCIDFFYAYTIQHFGDYRALARINWGAAGTILTYVSISTIAHIYYMRKVWTTTKGNRVITPALVFLILCHFGCGLASFALSLDKDWAVFRFAISSSTVMTVGLTCAAVVDNLIALIMMYYVWRAEAGGESQYRNRANLVLAYTVDTGALTAVFSLLSVILFGTQQHNLVFLGFIEMQTKLYANCLLGSLNVRALSNSHTCDAESATYQLRQQHLPHLHFGPGHVTNVTVVRETVITHEDGHSCNADSRKSAVIGVASAGGWDDGKGDRGLL